MLSALSLATLLVGVPNPHIEADVAVLKAVTRSYCEAKSEKGYYVLNSMSYGRFLGASADLDPAALMDATLRNQEAHPLPEGLDCDRVKMEAADKISASRHQKQNDVLWKGFYAAFPGAAGLMMLSLPGYSKDGQVALVAISVGCHDLCGATFLMVLTRGSGEWKVVSSQRTGYS